MNAHDVTELAAEDLGRDAQDAHVVVTDRGQLTARCSCWWTSGRCLKTPALRTETADTGPPLQTQAVDDGPVGRGLPPSPRLRRTAVALAEAGQTPAPEAIGLVGHYAALDPHAGRQVLDRACARLRAEGCTRAVGPMDGGTWGQYRFITERGAEPAFFLEPDNADQWPMDFVSAGFAPLATYHSAVASDLAAASAGAMEAEDRLNTRGITIRNLDPTRIDQELRHLYTVSLVSFEDNFLYTPITEDEFRRRYRAVLPVICPELVCIAEHDKHPIGFLFAVPDALEHRGANEPIGTVVVKTLAVLPQWRQAGVGKALLARTHGMARELGYRRAIHALMHDTGVSPMMSRKSARIFRRYTLFGRSL